ncbi:hypothetical protein ACNSO8_04200 [Yersinia sp. LJYL362]|uniref:hypothetical protein n=1 Tax=Yersinia sp. LJYL362 TaxID=3402108 RepID=UPI003AB1939F
MKNIDTVHELIHSQPNENEMVCVSGYFHPGDGGGAWFLWDSNSEAAINGGTVIGSALTSTGRWIQQHQGKGDFRTFGIMDQTRPADDALAALVNDPTIQQISAFSDLLFQRRHTFHRSNLLLDFQNHHVFTQGIEDAPRDDPFAAVLFFQGELSGQDIVVTLNASIQDQSDIFPVMEANAFDIGAWYCVQVDLKPGGGNAERELQKLVQVISIIDATHIQISYANGWLLEPGRVITWRKVLPTQNVTIQNMHFHGAGDNEHTGSHPIAFEYAVQTNVFGIHGIGTFWPVVMRRWNTHYITRQCSLINPPNTAWGGAGYLTQQIYCLYGHVVDCYTANSRHLNDFTASAYCLVENCHSNGQSGEKGPFVTHGQYEHDLTYTGNSGLMTFANSGAPWGGCAKRINVRKHVCPWFVARYQITDLTLEDVVVVADEAIASSGMIWVNADGLHMTGCSADRTLRISQVSQRSGRKNVITQCHFSLSTIDQTVIQANVSQLITFRDTRFEHVENLSFSSSAALAFVGCEFSAATKKNPLKLSSNHLSISACQFIDCDIALQNRATKQLDFIQTTFNNCTLDFTTFIADEKSSLIFSHNRLLQSLVINKPGSSPTVIWDQNITQRIE